MILGGDRIRFGGDYNPEQHPESLWERDIALMREAGVDLVNVGVFSWSRIQRDEGVFDFEWLDRVMDLLHGAGIKVGLATGTASPPPWATTRYPGMLPRDESGAVLSPGSRQHYSGSSPEYRRLAVALAGAIAERYVSHPAVALWHINNEYGCHVSVDYSDAAAAGFRGWLERRYVDIEALNHAWGTDFWSQRYSSFDEVVPPRRAPHLRNPAQLLDFRRFSSDALLECYVMEKEVLLDAGATQPMTTNLIGPWATLDLWRWAPHLDIVSDDSYPEPDDPEGFREAALHGELARGLADGGAWLRMEAAPNPALWRSSPVPRAAGRVRALAWQAVARGADGIQFFQWRQSPAGAEKFHTAMVPHAGTDTRSWREIAALGAELRDVAPTAPESHAPVALVIDFENWWALDSDDLPGVVDYAAIVRRWYRALHAQHVGVDIVSSHSRLDGYRLVIAPQLYLLDDDGARGIVDALDRGASVLLGAFSDVVDETVRFLPGGFLTRLGEAFGVRVEEQFALAARGTAGAADTATFPLGGGSVVVEALVDLLDVTDADVLSRFEGGRFAGEAALTVRHAAKSDAWYLAGIPDAAGTAAVVRAVLEACDIAPELSELPPHVEVARRGELLTVINHGPAARIRVDRIEWQTGQMLDEVDLPPFGVIRLRAPGSPEPPEQRERDHA